MAETIDGEPEFAGGGAEHPWEQLEHFARVAEAVAATTKKLEKAAFVGDYLKLLVDVDLSRAARYLAGHQFPLNDARTTNVGGSMISEALCQATGFTIEDLLPRFVRLGDAGEAAYEAVREAKHSSIQPRITLA